MSEVATGTIDQDSRLRIQASALYGLQLASEEILVKYFEVCQRLAIHARRVTIMQRDSQCFLSLCRMFGTGAHLENA